MPRFGTLGTQFNDDGGDPLISGLINFYETGTATRKTTYADAGKTVANSNPVVLTAAGRLDHDVYFDGVCDATLTTADGVIIESRSNIGGGSTSPYDDWSTVTIYSTDDIVTASNGRYYKSKINNNQSKDPSLIANAASWQEIPFTIGDVVFSADASLYTTPEWLKANGQAYNTTTYSLLAALLKQWPIKLTNPATLPPSTGQACSFNDDDTLYAVAHTTSPYVTIYSQAGDVFTKEPNPGTLPAGNATGCDFSADGSMLAVAHATTPFVTIYSITAGPTFTKEPNPATLPTGTGQRCQFSPDGNFLAVTHSTTPFVTFYSITAGPTFTKIANPATLPASTGFDVSFDPTSTYAAITFQTTGVGYVYKWNGTTFEKLADLPDLPSGSGYGVAFDPTGTYLAVGNNTSTAYLMLFERSGDTFTRLDIDELPSGTVNSIAWSNDGARLYVATGGSPYIESYSHESGLLTKLDTLDDVLPSTGNGVAFSALGGYLGAGHATSPYTTIYKMSDLLPKLSSFDGRGMISAYIKTGL